VFNGEYIITVAGPVRLVLFYDAGQVRDFGEKFSWKENLTRQVFPPSPLLVDPFSVLSFGGLEDPNAPGPHTEVIGRTSAFKTSTGAEIRFFHAGAQRPVPTDLRGQPAARRRVEQHAAASEGPSRSNSPLVLRSRSAPSMRRPIRRTLLLIPMLGIAAACGSNNNSTPTGPTTLPTVLTETFSGTLIKNAAYTHPFAVSDAGDVSVFLTASADGANPDNNAIPIGSVSVRGTARRARS
jgi:hypothetical protein